MNLHPSHFIQPPELGGAAATAASPATENLPPSLRTATPVLVRYWRIALRRRWLIVSIVTSALLLGLLATLLTTPQYTATASIEISRQHERILNVEGVEPKSEGIDLEFYQTQYSLLKSRSLAERVATELRLAQNDAFFDNFGVRPPDSGLFSDTDGRRLSSEQLKERHALAVEVLLENVSISPIRGSRLVDVSFTSPDRGLSQRVANAWTTHFIASNLDRRFEATSYARRFLEGRLEQLRRRLEESERQLVGYASAQGIVNIAAESNSPDAPRQERSLVAENLATLNLELTRATADRIRAEVRATRGGNSAEALNNNTLTTLRERRASLAAEYSRLLTQFEPEYPQARALKAQLTQLEQAISSEEARIGLHLSGNYREAVAREENLRRRVEELKANFQDLRRRSIQYNIYQRDVDTNRSLYEGLLQRYKEVGVAGGVGTNNVSVVDPARLPDKPSSPNLISNLLMALLFGIGLAGIIVFVLEQIDEALKDPSQVPSTLALPLLGAVPQVEDADPVQVLHDRKSAAAEAYLSVQTNLQFSTDHGVPHSLAITSTRAGEGKSTSAYAIALSLARTGANVVLVDLDMRSPSVGAILNVSANAGVSNFLAGDENLDAMLVRADAHGFHALLAGPPPPNAAELLTGPRLDVLISNLRGRFDYVIFDAPPVLGLADAPLISRRVEGIVYTVESGGPRVSAIQMALSRLKAADARLIGVVMTKFQAQKISYGYDYGYGYGYGNSDPKTA